MAKRSTKAERDNRAKRLARLLANGASGSDCVQFAADRWGIGERSARQYVIMARDMLKRDWNEVERSQMIAEVLSQYSTLQLEARRKNQLAVALGCINGAAKVAQLIS